MKRAALIAMLALLILLLATAKWVVDGVRVLSTPKRSSRERGDVHVPVRVTGDSPATHAGKTI